jgi:DNA modification methylase
MTTSLLVGDCRSVLPTLPAGSVHCVVTSPPYFGLRDYGVAGQLGLEPTPDEYVAALVGVFRDVRRVLRADGVLWLNLGDSYASGEIGRHDGGHTFKDTYERKAFGNRKQQRLQTGLKPKDLLGIPWRVAFALQADGWYLRQDIIWSKPNPMPESVRDRCTKAHEYLFLMSKSERYYYDAEAIAEPFADGRLGNPGNYSNGYSDGAGRKDGATLGVEWLKGADRSGRNRRSVWEIATQPYADAHFATFPPALIEPCILAGTSEKGCCAKCGVPWVREVERTRTNQSGSGRAGNPPEGKGGPNAQHAGTMQDIRMGPTISTETLGWSPSCSCNAAVVPCTVLDPFGGAGTTGLVADRLQRNAVLIELSPAYANMAEGRIKGDAPLFADINPLMTEVPA